MYNKKFNKEPTEKQKTGEIGENSACKYLEKNGFSIITRNYLRKWGEIDIVAQKDDILHFVEVKSVSRSLEDVLHETQEGDLYRAEDNMHPWKLERLSRTIQSYLIENDVSDETNWQFDLITVVLDKDKRQSYVSILEDIIID